MLVGSPGAGMLGWCRRSRRGNWCGWSVDWGPTGAALMCRRQVVERSGRTNWQHWGFSVHQAWTGELATLRVQCSSGTDGRIGNTEGSVFIRHGRTLESGRHWDVQCSSVHATGARDLTDTGDRRRQCMRWTARAGNVETRSRGDVGGLLRLMKPESHGGGGVLDCYSDETGVAVVVVNWTATVMKLESQWMRERRTVGRPWASAELCVKTKLLSGEKYRHLIQEKAGYWEWASRCF